jgi:hypothetical protein
VRRETRLDTDCWGEHPVWDRYVAELVFVEGWSEVYFGECPP